MEKERQDQLEKHRVEREKLQRDLQSVISRINYYLDANERELLEHRLPVKKFNIDVGGTERLVKAKQQQIQAQRRAFKRFCLEKKEIFTFIKEHLWEDFSVQPLKVRGVSAPFFVENYPIRLADEKLGNELWLREALDRDDVVKFINELSPWLEKTFSMNKAQLPEIDFDKPAKTADRFVTAATKIYDRCLKARSTSSHLFISPMAVHSEVVPIDDESQVFEHNIRVYVSKLDYKRPKKCINRSFTAQHCETEEAFQHKFHETKENEGK